MIDTKISIKHFPDRKKPCLVLEQGNRGLVLGYFRSDEMTKEKPCEYAEDYSGDCWECNAWYSGYGCNNVEFDYNHDGTVNIAICKLGKTEGD